MKPPRSRRKPVVPGLSRAVQIGPRVFLRRPTKRDERELMDLRRKSRRFLERWEPLGPGGRHAFGRSTFENFLRLSRSKHNEKLLICRVETGQIIGQVGLNGIARGPLQSTSMGYWIGQPFARRGFMTEAVGLMLAHAFGALELHRVEANIMPINKRSLGLVRKCGFRYEGTAKRFLNIAGRWRDHERWAMTVEEWRRRRPKAQSAGTQRS